MVTNIWFWTVRIHFFFQLKDVKFTRGTYHELIVGTTIWIIHTTNERLYPNNVLNIVVCIRICHVKLSISFREFKVFTTVARASAPLPLHKRLIEWHTIQQWMTWKWSSHRNGQCLSEPSSFRHQTFIDFHQDTRYARICQDPYLVTKQWTSSPKAQHRWGHDVVSSTDGTWCSSRRRWAWCDHGQLRDLSGLGKINEIPTLWKVPVH